MNCRCFDNSESAVIGWRNKNFGPRRMTFGEKPRIGVGNLGQIWTEGHVEILYNNLTFKSVHLEDNIAEATASAIETVLIYYLSRSLL
jgi:hypothetical protein